MKKPISASNSDDTLRSRAEQRLPLQPNAAERTAHADALALVHELQIHKIELQMQNDELRRAQVELTDLGARYRELYDFAPVGYLTLDAADRILETNLAGAALIGLARRDLINRSFPSFLSPNSHPAYRLFITSLQETGEKQTCELMALQSDGTTRYLQAEGITTDTELEADKQIRLAILDITERKQLEQLSQDSAQQFRSSFENVFDEGPLGIAFVDLDRRFLHVNKQLSTMLGYTPDELVAMSTQEVTHPDDMLIASQNARNQLDGGPANVARETRYHRKSGDVFWARTMVTLMRDSQNAPIHFLKIFEDITDQRIAEQRRLDAIVQERTRIAQEIHDTLAQGFTGILIQLQAAAYAPEQDQARVHIAQASDLARQSLQEARRSVRALRPKALEGSNLPNALAKLAAQITSADSMKVRFGVHGIPCLLPVEVEDHLYRIGQEALTNAIKHSEAAQVLLELWFEPTQVRLSIQDDGLGFDAKAGFQGSGFGLVGMSERAEQIGGKMLLAASPGHGTSITVTVSTMSALTEKSKR